MCGVIKIKQGSVNIPVRVENIIRFEGGKGNCSTVFLASPPTPSPRGEGGNYISYKVTGNIGEWIKDEEIIASGLFVLVHRSHLINYKQVTSYEKIHGATMSNNDKLPLTTEGFEELEKRIFSGDKIAADIYTAIQQDRKISFQREDEIPANDEEE